MQFLNLELKRATVERVVVEEPSSPPSPLSLSYPLPSIKTTITTTKRFGSTNSSSQNPLLALRFTCSLGAAYGVIGTIIGLRIVHWYMGESQNNNIFKILWTNITQVFGDYTRVFRGEGVAWDSLPPELWGEIGKRLVNRLDILCFRSMCKQWRSALPTPTLFPLLVPAPPSCEPRSRILPHFINEVSLYHFKRRSGCVGFEEVKGGKFLTHPIYPEKRKKYSEHPHSKMYLLFKGYTLRMSNTPGYLCSDKAVLISSKEDGVYPSYAQVSSLSVVAHMSRGKMKGRLALLRLGNSPEDRHWDTGFCTRVFEAIGCYKGKLCTLDSQGRVFLMDYESLQMFQIAPPLSIVRGVEGKWLTEVAGALYLTHHMKNGAVKGYKLSERHNKWLKCRAHKLPHIYDTWFST